MDTEKDVEGGTDGTDGATPAVDQAADPVAESEPAPESVSEGVSEPVAEPAAKAEPAEEPVAAAEPATEAAEAEAAVEAAAEPVSEAAEPVSEEAAEAEPVSEEAAEAAEPVSEEAAEAAEPVSEEAAEAAAEPVSEAAEPVSEESAEAAELAESEGAEEGAEEESEPQGPEMRWYAVHTYSGHENRARLSLLDRIKNAELQERFGEILIPTEQVVEVVKGQRRTSNRKFYPGYMFVQMVMDDHTRSLVKNTPKITGFLGGTNPVPVKDSEIAGINKQMTEGASKPKPRISFEEGENIRVTEGPFSNFSGIVEEVRPEKQKVRVLVSIFGRATPIELDYGQVEKA
jgi:transcriptional antiterminator NusG